MITLNAYAKINLFLDVMFKRDDGYHELVSLMQKISLKDTITMSPSDDIMVKCNIALPLNNTAYVAACVYSDYAKCGGADIAIKKRIPCEAGLGGGSADAAAVLRGMQQLYGGVSEEELFKMGSSIGADVPFCLAECGAAIVEGIGEKVTPIPSKKLSFLVIMKGEGISTAKLFKTLNVEKHDVDIESVMEAYQSGDKLEIGKLMHNSLETAACEMRPIVGGIKDFLLMNGACGACMTGSGAAVIGLFRDLKRAKLVAERFFDFDFVHPCMGR